MGRFSTVKMESLQEVFLGEIDRISSSGNAIVDIEDVKPLNGTEVSMPLNFINLGPLPQGAVGEEVLFTHQEGIFGFCTDLKYTDSDYAQKMSGRSESELAKLDIGIPEMISPGSILFLVDIVQITEDLPTDAQHLALVRVSPSPTDDSSKVSLTSTGGFPVLIQNLTAQAEFTLTAPISVEIKNIHRTSIETSRAFYKTQNELPDIGEIIIATTRRQTELGTLAVHKIEFFFPVLLKDAQYPTGETIKIRVNDIKGTYIVGEAAFSADNFDIISIDENQVPHTKRRSKSRVISQKVPIDIEPPPSNAPITNEVVVTGEDADALTGRWNIQDEVGSVEITEGDEIEIEIQSICGDSCLGYYSQFPVRVQFDRVVPPELKHQSLLILIQAIRPDRAIAEPTWVTETCNEFTVQVINTQSSDTLTINEGRLVMIPDSSVVSQGDEILVGPSELSNGDVATATVSARPTFQDTETTRLIRLPNTRGDVVYINKTPIVVEHLPNLNSAVTLGVSEVNEDHIVPSINALPETHLPDEDSYISAAPGKTIDNMIIGVEEELPIKLPLFPPTQDGTTIAQVIERHSESLLVVAGDVADGTNSRLQQVCRHMQLAVLALQKEKYQDAVKYVNEASQSCPSEFLAFKRLLTIEKMMIQVIPIIRDNADFRETADMLSQEANRILEFEDERGFTAEVDALLSARKAEIRATEQLLTALDEVDDEIGFNLQEIAQGVSAKAPAVKAAEHLSTAEKFVVGTPFESQIPSVVTRVVMREFEEAFPGFVDELQPFDLPKDDSDWFQYLIRVINRTDTAIYETDAGSDTWHRPATPETMGVTSMAEIGDGESAHIDPTQNSGNETATSERISTSGSSSEGETETNSADEASSSTATVETNELETRTETTNSTKESHTTNLPKLQRLRKQAEKESSENPKREDVSSSTTTTSRYKRSSAVREYALARADGTCELCEEDAPFFKKTGDPYLEVHHVNELSEGGADDPSIVGAVCPSCHKEIHYGEDGDELNEKLRERLQDGLGDVGVVDE